MDGRKTALICLIFQFIIILWDYFDIEEKRAVKRRNEDFIYLQQMQAGCLFKFKNKQKSRRLRKRWWVKKRSSDWWDRIVKNHFTQEDWLNNFRMTYETFQFLCRRLRPHLQSSTNYVRKPLSIEKKVAITLYKLASCAEYRIIGNQFGTHKCVVHKCVYNVCSAIYIEFRHEFLSMPNKFEAQEIAMGFEKICGIPNIIGAIDGTHVPILPPSDGYRDFVNRKGWPSFNMLALVDNWYRFRYITCQHPGSTHDAKVLKDSYLYQFPDKVIPTLIQAVNGIDMPLFIIGDPAYPLLPWLIKGYKGLLTPEEESFNAYLSRGRVVVENAFGRLKARFRCLLKRLDINYKFVPKVVSACVILHNIIETRKDSFMQNWIDAVKEAELEFPQPIKKVAREFDNLDGTNIRNTLKNYMTKFPLKKTKL